jgi:2'-5' RNA ligase
MKQRIFIALTLSPAFQAKALAWEEKYAELPVRWLAPKNWHITLVPPWYAEDIEPVKQAIEKAVRHTAPMMLRFGHIAYGPDLRHPRLIWVEGETPKKLGELSEKLHDAVNRKPERMRELKLHLTLARFRETDFASFPLKKLDERIDWEERADRVALMESHLSRSGADYEVLGDFELGAG